MFYTGLVSISFRNLSTFDILKKLKENDIKHIEWGSDIHAPSTDIEYLETLRRNDEEHGIVSCSYGSYFRIGKDDVKDFPYIIAAAKTLKADCIRVWCGNRNYEEYDSIEKRYILNDAKEIARLASLNRIEVCLECHPKTFTNSLEGAKQVMSCSDNTFFKMYWQPNQFVSFFENIEYIKGIKELVKNVHVFNWKEKERFSLDKSTKEWIEYLSIIKDNNNHGLLLEFMPNDDINELKHEHDTLKQIIEKI